MDIAFRENAPIQCHRHVCSGTEAGTTTQDAINDNKANIIALHEKLANEDRTRTDQDINRDIGVLEADNILHQSNFGNELNKVEKVVFLHLGTLHQDRCGAKSLELPPSSKREQLRLIETSPSSLQRRMSLAHTPCCRTS